MPAPTWRGCHIWGQMCAWQMPNLHESPWSCRDGAGSCCGIHPRKLGPENQNLPHLGWAAGSLSAPLAFRGQRRVCTTNPTNLYHPPLLPGPASSAQWLHRACEPESEGGSRRAKALSCEGPSGAARPQTAKLPLDVHAHRRLPGSGCGSSASRIQTKPLPERR